ncbi:hypothetical protein HBH56_189980 [Parastagonospora nodorum]|uniref:DNA/RNA-binding domain-containing protein n=1 Tax=Phaeosphaeria nodorum (strain SN15 / ATCC MYA-4574 / FGSC 10173) TaxID=321614 RepID=A0A7U2HXK1_PHANO|nr:hypothetical protein HBH56_189980 [Parastagonospora nodorum]QRC92371.1 hypothetical protein JI435_024890 [Parastagonospora nodorum SN15]KAH3925205.1 hypothetical protein HBH54_185790 [Parastagonospora nodorum]KAH4131897.1 hypothetical protein HBH45_189770 [Parastagonospora nodorum]KAH4151787.1 hypothetical protein HBH44_167820 [Parastagonospora nodorum]
MAVNTELLDRRAKAIEHELYKRADGGAACTELAAVLQEYRASCEALSVASFEYFSAHETEQKLWAAHLKVNTAFRQEHKILKRSKEHVVELRKFNRNYMHFIKGSQRFYRQYILNFDAQFDAIPELRRIAQKWKDDASKKPPRQRIPATLNDQVLLSCHQTLIHLGDLSRYRETLVPEKDKERNWGPAKGYYGLAAELYPDSGHAHNQLAVVSREDGDHFRTVYHLYRSLASKLPYPAAQGNLETEFKRIIVAWEKGQLINNQKSSDGANAGRALIAWFVRLHSKIYKGEEFAAHDELEGEVLSHLAIELKERPLDSILSKIILVNLAAEHFATVQMQGPTPPENIMRTYFMYLRLNVKTFFVLLQVLQPELERLSEADDVTKNGDRAAQLSDKITAVARRTLPGLRLYSTWFSRCWQVLNANIADTLTTVDVQELWKAYAATLTLLASSFPVDQLPEEDYMLEEDTDTIGFQPLVSPNTMKVWYNGENMKQKWTDLERNHPNVEMLMRVKDLLIDGLLLTQTADAPLDLDGSRFIYREEGLPSELLASPSHPPDSSPVLPMQAVDLPLFPPQAPAAEDQKSQSVAAGSESASTTIAKESAMHRMVDDLVGPDDGLDPLPEEDEDMPPTPPEQTFADTAVVNDGTYASASLSISDLVNSVKNYKPLSPAPGTAFLSTPMGRSGSTSSIRQPVNLPSVPDGQWSNGSIWSRNYSGTPGPSSPLMPSCNGAGSEFGRSPLTGNGLGHVRQGSSNSLLGAEVTPSGVRAPRPISGGLGSGAAWGNPSSASPTYWGSVYGNGFGGTYNGNQNGINNDVNMASPLLFSSYQDKANSSWGRTPPNGQGG